MLLSKFEPASKNPTCVTKEIRCVYANYLSGQEKNIECFIPRYIEKNIPNLHNPFKILLLNNCNVNAKPTLQRFACLLTVLVNGMTVVQSTSTYIGLGRQYAGRSYVNRDSDPGSSRETQLCIILFGFWVSQLGQVLKFKLKVKDFRVSPFQLLFIQRFN